MSITYKHYGAKKFNYELIKHQFSNNFSDPWISLWKPYGLWGCRKDQEFNWYDYCSSQNFRNIKEDDYFYFKLRENTKVLEIHNAKDIIPYTYLNITNRLNLNKLVHDYDAIELFLFENYEELHYNDIFYSWDIDSICVWNPQVIIPLKREEVELIGEDS